jgi:hypothetical protein
VISLSLIIKTFEYLQELQASDMIFIKKHQNICRNFRHLTKYSLKTSEYLQELLASDKYSIKNISAQNNSAYPHPSG